MRGRRRAVAVVIERAPAAAPGPGPRAMPLLPLLLLLVLAALLLQALTSQRPPRLTCERQGSSRIDLFENSFLQAIILDCPGNAS